MKTTLAFLWLCMVWILPGIDYSYGQVSGGPCPVLVLQAGNTPNADFIPPNPNVFSIAPTATCVINVTYLGSWPGPAMQALQHAVFIWEHTVSSTVPIELDASWENLGSGILGKSQALQWWKNFGSVHPDYFPNTWYAIALANKLHGSDLNTSVHDLKIRLNSSVSNWYFGLDGNATSSQYDFVTTCIHEIGHGLGFFSSIILSGSNPVWGNPTDGNPVIYDKYIVNSGNTRLTNFPASTASAALTAYLTSNDLYLDGPATSTANGGNARIYAPSTFSLGSSISHFDQATFGASNNPNRLMIPIQNPGQGVHNPGAVGVGVLDDIGWDADLIGIEDWIDITGFTGNPPVVLQENGTFAYQIDWHDEAPTGNYLMINTIQWRIEVLHRNGRYLLATGNAVMNWAFTLPTLPPGYDWNRDNHGRVWAVVTTSVIDNDNYGHTDEVNVGIDYAPEKAHVNLSNQCPAVTENPDAVEAAVSITSDIAEWQIGKEATVAVFAPWEDNSESKKSNLEVSLDWIDWKDGTAEGEPASNNLIALNAATCCSAAGLNFYSSGATSYYILYRKVSEITFNMVQVPVGQYSKTINGLDEHSNYIFYVGAVNSSGTTLSNPLYRYACKGEAIPDSKITVTPNPTDNVIHLAVNSAALKISRVEISKLDDPVIGTVTNFASPEPYVDIQVNDLPAGWYAVTVKGDDNKIYYAKFLKN